MVLRIPPLQENKSLRTIIGTIGVLTALVVFTDMTLRRVVPLAFIFIAMMMRDIVDETYDLPVGTNWLVYGASIFVVGAYWVFSYPTPWVGGLLALAGLWFVFDGVTTIRFEPSQREHEYVSDLDGKMDETMLRIQTLNVVYQTLRDASEPQTAAELATDRDLTESRVNNALEFLESTDRVEQVGGQYRAVPPQWGKVSPIIELLVWFPRRIVRPFHRVCSESRS